MIPKADLHCHSTCSDGSLTPEELVLLAAEKGLCGLSITDHDTVAAYPHIISFAREHHIQMITGVELSAFHEGKSVHVLGYNFNPLNETLLDFCAQHTGRRLKRNKLILELLDRQGFHIAEEELYQNQSNTIGRPHIADLLVKKGYIKDIQTAFKKLLGDGKACYAQGPVFSVEDTLAVIRAAGGISVLAHPHLMHNKKFVRKVIALGFDGIECDYATFPMELNAPWHSLANELNLLKTAGSDFHGSKKPGIPLGASAISLDESNPFVAKSFLC